MLGKKLWMMKTMMTRTYTELTNFSSFEDRYNYLKLGGRVGESTFGFDRYINQSLYHSREWKTVRNHVIIRDLGCDLGVSGYEINSTLLVHHMNPINVHDILGGEDDILDPEFLITTTSLTHNAIHYGDPKLLLTAPKVRTPGDTKLW
jgi:hypothetical protein